MKKAFLLLCMAVGLMSCAKEPVVSQEETGVPMNFNISVTETKAELSNWVNGDKIFVFFNGLGTKYLELTYNSGSWVNASAGGTLTTDDFSALGTKTLTAVHFPVAVDVAYADSKFTFTCGDKPVYKYYLFQTGKSYTVDGTTVSASLSMGKPDGVAIFHITGNEEPAANYSFGCSKIRPVACASIGTDGAITEIVLQAGARLYGIDDSNGVLFAGRLVYPGEEKDYKFTLACDSKIYTLTRTNKSLTAGKMYNFPSLPATSDANWTVQDASDLYVDLGLSVKWAKYNVGATSETDYGDYFSWGEVTGYNEGKTYFTWLHYAWGTDGNALTKYCNNAGNGKDGFTDALTTLVLEDDAAYAALGGKFRMPTKSEWDALRNTKTDTENYTWTWCDGSAEKYNDSTTPGLVIVRKSTSATLFLPAAGRRTGSSLSLEGTCGFFWSSSLYTDGPNKSWEVRFVSEGEGSEGIGRSVGYSVRPVTECFTSLPSPEGIIL